VSLGGWLGLAGGRGGWLSGLRGWLARGWLGDTETEPRHWFLSFTADGLQKQHRAKSSSIQLCKTKGWSYKMNLKGKAWQGKIRSMASKSRKPKSKPKQIALHAVALDQLSPNAQNGKWSGDSRSQRSKGACKRRRVASGRRADGRVGYGRPRPPPLRCPPSAAARRPQLRAPR